MQGRTYTVVMDGVSVTNAGGDADIFELTPADDRPIRILGWTIDVSSEVGDAAEEILRYAWIRGHTTSGNGTSVTPRPAQGLDTAAGFTAEYNGATIASAGTGVTLYSGAFNVRSGERIFLPPECRFGASQADTTLVLRLLSTVADDVTMSATAFVEECY